MDSHENARTTRRGRMLMIERLHAGWSVAAVADSLGVCVLGRKNYLFCGSDAGGQRAACMYTIIETCGMSGINPQAYLTDIIGTIADHPIQKLDDLLPWRWKS